MAATDRRRAILQTIIDDPESSTSDVLRACELAEKLDGHPELDPDYEAWKTYMEMPDEKLDAELAALMKPLSTGPYFGDDPEFEKAVQRETAVRVNEQTAAIKQEMHQLRKALAAAEARKEPPTLPEQSQAGSEPPSAPAKPKKDAGAVVADMLAARERLWPDGPPERRFGRRS